MIDVKDRVPTYPGRVKLTPVSGQENTFDMVRADQPTEPGTPINKKLFDDFYKDLNYKIGDIRTTMRTDLGDKWLLCNGDSVDPAIYPELAALCPADIATSNFSTTDLWSGSSQYISINCIAYADGYWVVGGQYYDGTTCHARVAYTEDLRGEWTIKDLWSGSYSVIAVTCIINVNGRWVIGGTHHDGSAYTARIAHTTDILGEWTIKDLWSGSNSVIGINCITYSDGIFAVGGQYMAGNTCYAHIAYTPTLDGEWSSVDLWWASTNTHSTVNCITHADGHWAAGGRRYDGTRYNACIAYATDLSDEWTTVDLWSVTNYTDNVITCMKYADGYWVAGGRYSGSSIARGTIAYATNLNGNWTNKDLWGSTMSTPNYITCIEHTGKQWIACGVQSTTSSTVYGCIAHTVDLSGTWTIKNLWTSRAADMPVKCLCVSPDFVFGGKYFDTTNYARIAYAAGAILPVITGPAYTYIKALEG